VPTTAGSKANLAEFGEGAPIGHSSANVPAAFTK
jgi:hypothetical protein